jgi:hypothetical protein
MTNGTVYSPPFQPAKKIWPTAAAARPPGPPAQQPTGGLPKQPARAARLGQFWPSALSTQPEPSITADGDPTAPLPFRWYIYSLRLHPFETLNISFLLPDPAALPAAHRRRRRVARGQPLPATATRAPARPKAGGVLPFLCSFSSPLFPSPKHREDREVNRHGSQEKTAAAPPRALSPVSAFPTRESAPPSRGCTAVPSGPKPARR